MATNNLLVVSPKEWTQTGGDTRTMSFGAWVTCAAFRGLGLLGVLWVVFNLIHECFPYVRSGAEIICEAKAKVIQAGSVFRLHARTRVVFAGNSKVLAGFIPQYFDALSMGAVESYNLGLPEHPQFVEDLELLTKRGQLPTHVLLMHPWPNTKRTKGLDIFRPSIEDARVMDAMFPFRGLPRNLALFLARAESRGGVAEFYAEGRRQTDIMLVNRGYYFIEGQSHYPNDALPDQFALQRDSNAAHYLRRVCIDCPAFTRLSQLLDRYDIHVVFVPAYYRAGEYAPAPERSQVTYQLTAHPRFTVVGPDYWSLPNGKFSDPVHLNRNGAAVYTRKLWDLLNPIFK